MRTPTILIAALLLGACAAPYDREASLHDLRSMNCIDITATKIAARNDLNRAGWIDTAQDIGIGGLTLAGAVVGGVPGAIGGIVGGPIMKQDHSTPARKRYDDVVFADVFRDCGNARTALADGQVIR